jgi:hypothetical protein
MTLLLIVLIMLISLLILASVFTNAISAFLQKRLPTWRFEGEHLLLWGGMLLAAFAIGLLVMYLFLRHGS